MNTITKPGIYRDFPVDDYFADPTPEPSFTQSLAKLIVERSPLHAKIAHPRLAPAAVEDEPAEKYVVAKAIGNMVHMSMIGRGKDVAIGDFDSWRSDKAKKFREENEAAGKTVILYKHSLRAHEMVLAIRLQLIEADQLSAFRVGDGEVVVAWQEDGFWFRTLIDWMESPVMLWDLKTSGLSCAPHALGQMIERAGWHIQAAMHERALDAVDPDNAGRRHFRFVAVENEPPYALVPVELDEHWLTMGRKQLAYAISHWKFAMGNGQWPSYPRRLIVPDYPGFREQQWLDREERQVDELARRKDEGEPLGGLERAAFNLMAG